MAKDTRRQRRKAKLKEASNSPKGSTSLIGVTNPLDRGFQRGRLEDPLSFFPPNDEAARRIKEIILGGAAPGESGNRQYRYRLFLQESRLDKVLVPKNGVEALRNQSTAIKSSDEVNISDTLAQLIDRLYTLLERTSDSKVQAGLMLAIQEAEQKSEAIKLDGKHIVDDKSLSHLFDKLQSSFSPDLMPDN